MDAEPPKRKRRWYQFRLRTLLIVVTLLAIPCAYIGWQVKIVRSRIAALRRIENVDRGEYWGEDSQSWLRRILGDKRIGGIILPANTSFEERRSLRAEFPELVAGIVYRGSHSTFASFADDPNPRSPAERRGKVSADDPFK